MSPTTPRSSTSVLVSGAGPVGLALAVELGLRGVEVVVAEPRTEPTRLRPRAKTLNARTMEHVRRWGLTDRLRAAAPLAVSWSQDVAFRTSFLGTEITRFTGVLGLADDGTSPERGQQMPQYVLETLLRQVVAELPTCDLRIGARVSTVRDRGPAVEVVLDRDGVQEVVEAEYVVGADGGRSVVRDQIGARYEGAQALRPNTGIVFHAPQLGALAPHPPAVQTWLLNGSTPGMMGPVDRDGTWWLIAFGVDGTSADLDPQRLVDGALGRHLPVEVVSTDPWTARMELVDRCRVGRVFLVGDAAHLNPPFGGHGLNTGIGDAVDLGWKLAATVQGWAGLALLDSYEAERRPLHRRVIAEATANMAVLAPELLSPDLEADGAQGLTAREAAAARIHTTKRAEYFSSDLVLGHRYTRSPLLPGDDEAAAEDDWHRAAAPGRRLPHRWLTPTVSTLDLVRDDHVLLVDDRAVARPLAEAADRAGVPVDVVDVDRQVLDGLGARALLVRPDQVVAWCGTAPPPDPDALIGLVSGHCHQRAEASTRP